MTTREKFEKLMNDKKLKSPLGGGDLRETTLFLKALPDMRVCVGVPHFANANVIAYVDYLYKKTYGE